ncbi:NADH-cytochrome b5 reductase [Anaeramoeba flamelloides]|uniref:NADH-cytochrome b5 reductase n=1 Tax=Anaeramoeba flamelloides TaxID=1746091 RepID=A0ABQ8X7K0_9EUKA|nr:NADH-cytochrome b5 reductase [Anaeramoeba flamelloides]
MDNIFQFLFTIFVIFIISFLFKLFTRFQKLKKYLGSVEVLSDTKFSPFVLKKKKRLTNNYFQYSLATSPNKNGLVTTTLDQKVCDPICELLFSDSLTKKKKLSTIIQPGRHITLQMKINQKYASRTYCPVIVKENQMDLVIQTIDNGKISTSLEDLELESVVHLKGATGNFSPENTTNFIVNGYGICCVLRVLQNSKDKKLRLMYQNDARTYLFNSQLEQLEKNNQLQIQRYYHSSRGSNDNNFNEAKEEEIDFEWGKISKQNLFDFLIYKKEKNVRFAIAGDPSFKKRIYSKLMELGIDTNLIYRF